MNFGVIFICLLIGAVIGFEAGKYMVSKKVSELIKSLAGSLKKDAEEAQKKWQEADEKIAKLTADILRDLEKLKDTPISEEKKHADRMAGDTDGDDVFTVAKRFSKPIIIDQDKQDKTVRPVYLNNRGDKDE